MVKVSFVPATEEHARELAADMREEEVRELALVHRTPLEGLMESLEESDFAISVFINGELAYIFGGLLPTPYDDIGVIWGLGGNVCNRYPMTFYRFGRRVLDIFLDICPHWFNRCDAGYSKSIKWLEKMGFEIGEVERFMDGDFRRIDLRRKTCV